MSRCIDILYFYKLYLKKSSLTFIRILQTRRSMNSCPANKPGALILLAIRFIWKHLVPSTVGKQLSHSENYLLCMRIITTTRGKIISRPLAYCWCSADNGENAAANDVFCWRRRLRRYAYFQGITARSVYYFALDSLYIFRFSASLVGRSRARTFWFTGLC